MYCRSRRGRISPTSSLWLSSPQSSGPAFLQVRKLKQSTTDIKDGYTLATDSQTKQRMWHRTLARTHIRPTIAAATLDQVANLSFCQKQVTAVDGLCLQSAHIYAQLTALQYKILDWTKCSQYQLVVLCCSNPSSAFRIFSCFANLSVNSVWGPSRML